MLRQKIERRLHKISDQYSGWSRGLALDAISSEPGLDIVSFFDDKAKWSIETFGPGDRYVGVIKHIRKELKEIEENPSDLVEWVDVIFLAMDGAMRSAGADGAALATAMRAKHAENKVREWPDWRTLQPGEVSQHIKASDGDDERRSLEEVGAERDAAVAECARMQREIESLRNDSEMARRTNGSWFVSRLDEIIHRVELDKLKALFRPDGDDS